MEERDRDCGEIERRVYGDDEWRDEKDKGERKGVDLDSEEIRDREKGDRRID
jgi:hypothetical protein